MNPEISDLSSVSSASDLWPTRGGPRRIAALARAALRREQTERDDFAAAARAKREHRRKARRMTETWLREREQ